MAVSRPSSRTCGRNARRGWWEARRRTRVPQVGSPPRAATAEAGTAAESPGCDVILVATEADVVERRSVVSAHNVQNGQRNGESSVVSNPWPSTTFTSSVGANRNRKNA
eukprot:1195761-Prorocentrum_minimum.AAC.5